jgi:hypothetical protein
MSIGNPFQLNDGYLNQLNELLTLLLTYRLELQEHQEIQE